MSNIIRFIEFFQLNDERRALVFEMMEVTLRDFFLKERNAMPLCFKEVRSIIQQVCMKLPSERTTQRAVLSVHCVNLISDLCSYSWPTP